jgi:hypothetical protein
MSRAHLAVPSKKFRLSQGVCGILSQLSQGVKIPLDCPNQLWDIRCRLNAQGVGGNGSTEMTGDISHVCIYDRLKSYLAIS